MAAAKLDRATRIRLHSRIRELFPTMRAKDLVNALQSEGFRQADGSDLTFEFVRSQIASSGVRKFKKRKYARVSRNENTDNVVRISQAPSFRVPEQQSLPIANESEREKIILSIIRANVTKELKIEALAPWL